MTIPEPVTDSSSRHRRERRSIPPFGDGTDPNAVSNALERVLSKCRFARFAQTPLSDQDTHFLRAEASHLHIEPSFDICLEDTEGLSRHLGLQTDDLEVGLSVRSPRLKRYEVLARCKADALPDDPWSPDRTKLQRLQCGRGMDFILTLRVASDRSGMASNGIGCGKVLIRKVFSVRESTDNFTFPCVWKEFGGNSGYPDEALWAIKWHDTAADEDDFRRPVAQVLTVLVNTKAEPPLSAMGQVQGVNDLAWRMLAADVTTHIWATVLTRTSDLPQQEDTETLAGQVFARLSQVSGLSYQGVKDLAPLADDCVELRNLVAKVIRIVR